MKHIARSSLIVGFFFGIDKILAFGRTLLLGRQFDLSYELDVFNAANNIPDLLSAMISGGALGVALIPVLSEYLETRGKKDAWNLFVRILNLAFLVTAAISVVLAIFAPALIDNVIAPGFPAAEKALASDLMRLDLIAILIFSISGLVMAGLQANQHFLTPALAPGLYNIGQIFGLIFLVPSMGIYGLVYGVIIGALLHLAIQLPALYKHGFKWEPVLGLNSPGVRKVLILLGPRVVTMFFVQMFFIVRDNLASGMGEGAVSALNFGWFIMQVPETMLGTAIAIALLPSIAELFAREEFDKFKDTLNGAIRAMLAFTIPCAFLIAAGIQPLVEFAFDFDAEGTMLVVWAARAYLVGLAGHALLEIAIRTYYAKQNAIVPLIAAALNATVYLGLAILFADLWGTTGIALANSIVFTTEAALLLWLLSRAHPGIVKIRDTLIRVLSVSAIAGLIVWLVVEFISVNSLYTSVAGMGLGLVAAIIVMLPEIRLVLKLGDRE